MKVFFNISKLYSFKGFALKKGVRPLEEDLKPIKDAAMITDKSIVLWVGKEKDLQMQIKKIERSRANKKSKIIKYIDLKKKNVFPSFTESHTHLVFGGDRKKEFDLKTQGATYQEIAKMGGGISSTVKETQKASANELLNLAQKRVNEFKKQGVSLLEVKSGYGGNFKTEKKILDVAFKLKGLKVIPTYLALHAIPKGKQKESYVEQVVQVDLPKMKKSFPKLKRVDLFVEKGYFTKSDLEALNEKARVLKLDLCAHVDQLTSLSGALAAAKLGALSVEHAVFLKQDEIKKLSKQDTIINLLPGADFYLDTKYPDARKLIDAGCKVSLATDFNPGSSPTQSLSFIGVLARRNMSMSLAEVWCSYTYNASKALGVFNKGALIKGFQSSFFTSQASVEDFFYEVGSHPVDKLYL